MVQRCAQGIHDLPVNFHVVADQLETQFLACAPSEVVGELRKCVGDFA